MSHYVTKQIVYTVDDYECGHHATPEGAYEEIATRAWFDAVRAGKVVRADTDASIERMELVVARLARWMAWSDSVVNDTTPEEPSR